MGVHTVVWVHMVVCQSPVHTVVYQSLPLHTLVTPLLLAPLSTVLLPSSASPLPQPSLPLNHTLSTLEPRLQLLLIQLNNTATSSNTRYIIPYLLPCIIAWACTQT